MKKITIAIDGFSSCGKSTMAKSLAKNIGYIYVDSGAMYRAITLFCLENNLIKDNKVEEVKLKSLISGIDISFEMAKDASVADTYLNGKNVEKEIRGMLVSNNVSVVSAIGFVRKAMVAMQQKMGKGKGIVMDGRDIGSVVFPNAELKIFITADPQVRAQRRFDELRDKGDTNTSFEDVLANIEQRDHLDQTRAESPLKRATDAIELDNSYLSKDEQMTWLLNIFNKKISS